MDQIELIDKRKPREKHFLQRDGTIKVEIYNEDIHYLKDNKYEEIDNTLIKEKDSLVNKSNDYKVEFKNDIRKSLMKMSKNNHYIEFKLKDNKSKEYKKGIRKLSGKNITYSDITDNIKVEYQTLSNKVKETIVLQNSNYEELNFNIDTDLDLELVNEEILSKDKNNNVIFKIDKPFMYDSNKIRNDNINYLINKTDQGYELRLILDDEWLKSPDRLYPVYIDPTISNESNNLNVYDTFIHPLDEGLYNSFEPYLKVGVDNETGVLRPNRTLIKFDLPTIGTGSEIIDAQLYLTPELSENGEPLETISEIHRINVDWDEDTATWNDMNDKYDKAIESLLIGRRRKTDAPLEAVYYTTDITNLVRKWYNDTKNQGIMIKAISEENYVPNYPKFHSNDNYYQYSDPRPYIKISYRNQNGIIGHMDYKEESFELWSSYINTYNGNMIVEFELSNVIGTKLPMEVRLIYNTNDVVLNNDLGYGKGFKLNLDQNITSSIINGKEYLEFLNEYGTLYYFYKKNKYEDIYYDEDNLGLTIIKENENYIMSDNNGNQMIFVLSNDKYWLKEIKDKKNNTLTIYRDLNNKINKIECDNSNIIFTYDDNKIKIESSLNYSIITYSNGKIVNIKNKKGIINIEWNDLNLISKIKDVTGISCLYEYYENKPHRLKKQIKFGVKQSIKESNLYEYGNNSTSILNNNDKYEIIIYDNNGSIKSVNILNSKNNLNSAYSTSAEYGKYNSERNKLISTTSPIRYVKNYLTNTSFEEDSNSFIFDEDIESEHSTMFSYSGNRSLRIKSLIDGSKTFMNISVPKGTNYTFSGYFKNSEDIILSLSYLDEEGNQIINSKKLKHNDIFERNDLSIYYDELASSNLTISILFPSIGETYIDDIQLEQGEIANVYNYIDNSDFSMGLSGWELSAYDIEKKQHISDVSSIFQIVNVDNVNALQINMKPYLSTSVRKNFPIKGKKNEVYTISFWYKNSGLVPIRPHTGNYVVINFKSKNQDQEYCVATSENFNSNPNKWQYFTYRDVAIEDYESISLNFIQDTDANEFLITNMTFSKENTSGDYKYDKDGNIISITNELNEQTNFTYNYNKLTEFSNTIGESYKYEHDNINNNKINNILNHNSLSNEFEYDNNDNIISTKLVNKNVEQIENNKYRIRSKGSNLYLKAELNALIFEKSKCSNTVWNIIKENDKFEIHYSVMQNHMITYNRNNEIILSTGEENNKFLIEKNGNGSYYIAIEEDNNNERKYLKANNNMAILCDLNINDPNFEFYIEYLECEFIEENKTYTEDGRFLKSIIDNNFNETKFNIDSITGLTESITNAKGVITEYDYNEKDEINYIRRGNKQLLYNYDKNGEISDLIIADSKYTFEYDEYLNVVSTKINNVITLTENEYDKYGNVLSVLYGNNQKILFESDNFDRVKKITRDDDIIEYKYDCYGNVAKIKSSYGVINQYFDVAKRLIKYELGNYNVTYSYNSNNSILSKNFELDTINRKIINKFNKDVLIEQNLDNDVVKYDYDSLGRIRKQTLGNNHVIEYEYITKGKRTSLNINKVNHKDTIFEYIYDELNNISEIFINGNKMHKFSYDIYNQLIEDIDYSLNKTTKYLYDSNSNLIKETIEDIITGTSCCVNQFKYENLNYKCMLTEYNGIEITYDDIGNPVSIGENINLKWINGKMLKQYSDLDKKINVIYEYNTNGIRKSKIVNGNKTEYFLENDDIIYERRNNEIIYYLYDLTGVIGLEFKENRYYFEKNIQDDVIAILDSNDEIVAKYSYDIWGKLISITDNNGNIITDNNHIANINPFRYRSYYYDSETELYYNNRRYYNPKWRRFISMDSIIGANNDLICYNLYVYCSNNPIVYKDSLGNSSLVVGLLNPYAVGVLLLGVAAYCAVKASAPAISSLISNMSTPPNKTKNKKSSDSDKSTRKDRDKNDNNKYVVYALKDNSVKPPKIEYIGRTKDITKTKRRHQNNVFRSSLVLDPISVGLSYEEARMLEQVLITQCQTLNKNKDNPINNQINGIDKKKELYNKAYDFATFWFDDEHLSPC